MGVPGFFLWLMKQYKNKKFVFPKANMPADHSINKIDWFLIDMNCMIHPVCFKTLEDITKNLDNNKIENRMIDRVIEYLESTIAHAKPNKGIYIAIDGVAPVAKMKQQRLRRYKSIHDNALYTNLRKKHNKIEPVAWSNSSITPGTLFMKNLNNRINDWAKIYSKKNKLEIIFSSSNVPGEGEHKLLQYIRNNTDKSLYYVIYGLDADLLFLALATNLDTIYLMREGKILKDCNTESDGFNFVSISIMKECIVDTMEKQLNILVKDKMNCSLIEMDRSRLSADFIFICYLMGNDFLPNLPSLNIYEGAISLLIKYYIETLLESTNDNYLINRTRDNINTDTFYKFIDRLASIEEETLKASFLKKKYKTPCTSEDPYDIEVHRIENMRFKVDDKIQLGSDSMEQWRPRYYSHYYNTTNVSSTTVDTFSKKMVEHYMLGLKWVTLYYFDKCPDWEWFYPYDHPPFLQDISSNKFNFDTMIFSIDQCTISPFEQLLIVLPRQSAFLLPEKLRKIMLNLNSSAVHLYPTTFELDLIGKKKYWMCTPILPDLEIDLIKALYKKYAASLSSDVKEMNQTTDISIYRL